MGEMVEFPCNGEGATGYLALPASGRGPGVVVIQEWWGIVSHIKNVCERFAEAGFVALAPDLYHGKTTTEPDEAGKLIMELQLDRAGREIAGAGRWLAASERTAGDHVGIVGFCAGGALALYAATLSEVFTAAVAFYPGLAFVERAQPDFTAARGSVLLHWAEHDHAYDRESSAQLEERLRAAGLDVLGHWYDDSGHAFFNDDRPEVYKPEQARLAWDRTLAFFRKHLAATPAPV
ncbi:MAG TPA: dienelactone hydrolase family protein [Candidatus Dormibacteraeota bacterium]